MERNNSVAGDHPAVVKIVKVVFKIKRHVSAGMRDLYRDNRRVPHMWAAAACAVAVLLLACCAVVLRACCSYAYLLSVPFRGTL